MKKAVIVDIGSYETKCGLSDMEKPHIFKTEIDGKFVIQRCRSMKITDYEAIFKKVWKLCGVKPEKYPLLISEAAFFPLMIKEKITKMLFDKFNVPAINFTSHNVLEMFSFGETSGLSVNVGHGLCQISPVVEGYGSSNCTIKINVAGHDVDNEFLTALKERSIKLSSFEEVEALRRFKEKECFVSTDFQADVKKWKGNKSQYEKSFDLPDGRTIKVDVERFRAPEALFSTSHRDIENIPSSINISIRKSMMDLRKTLWKNIIVSGETAKMKGFIPRLKKELAKLSPLKDAIVVKLHPEEHPEFVGGCVLAELHTFDKECFTKKDYKELGVKAIHKMRRIKFC